MVTSLPRFHKKMLSEGRTKRGTEVVLIQELRPEKSSTKEGLVYESLELVTEIKDRKYGLGWDKSLKSCHRGMSPFAVPQISLFN